MPQTVISYVCLEGQWYETVVDPVDLVVSRIERVAVLPTLTALHHSPLISDTKVSRKPALICSVVYFLLKIVYLTN